MKFFNFCVNIQCVCNKTSVFVPALGSTHSLSLLPIFLWPPPLSLFSFFFFFFFSLPVSPRCRAHILARKYTSNVLYFFPLLLLPTVKKLCLTMPFSRLFPFIIIFFFFFSAPAFTLLYILQRICCLHGKISIIKEEGRGRKKRGGGSTTTLQSKKNIANFFIGSVRDMKLIMF